MKSASKILRIIVVIAIAVIGTFKTISIEQNQNDDSTQNVQTVSTPAGQALAELPIKGRAPKTGYTRAMFGSGWEKIDTCDMRNYVLARDMSQLAFLTPTCKVASGTLEDPYTGKTIHFVRGIDTSDDVQIDHVVALSDAWQKGAQQLSQVQREALANDPLELLAVDGNANQQKSDSDAASWLPSNKSFRCAYVARQIAVKKKYSLWVTRSEYDAIARILQTCPDQRLPES